MSAWSIDPASVGNIIESEKTEADTNFNTALTGISNAESGLITATQTDTPLVAVAVSDWFSTHETDFTGITNTISNVLTNTVNAVNAYTQHDDEAALEYQRQAK